MMWAIGGNPCGKLHCYEEFKFGAIALCNYQFTWTVCSVADPGIAEEDLCQVCVRVHRAVYGEPEILDNQKKAS